MLRDLGIMRLMYFAEVPNMERRFPDAWALYHDQLHWTERYWYLARARAVKHFRSLLRFLPHGELPIHGDRKSRKGKAPN
jgi:hypothetical protein